VSDLRRLYDTDYAAWSARTAELLRQRRFADLDIDHLVEELEDIGKNQRHELVNRLRVLLAHLLKWQYQYQQLPERWAEFEGKSWRNTILEQRAALKYLIEKNPGLQRLLPDAIAEAYRQAAELSAEETGRPARTFPTACPYAPDQALDGGYLPPHQGP
jgi:hypothetical protein